MRLKRIKVIKLFGLFDHEVDLRLDDRITIIHAPNGYGKTVLLKLIAAMFGGSLAVFRDYEFKTVEFELDDGSRLNIISQPLESQAHLYDGATKRSYRIEYKRGKKLERWSPDDAPSSASEVGVSASMIDRYVPGLRRTGPRAWRNASGESMVLAEVIERYWSHFPPSARRGRHQPEWLVVIRDSLNCRLIETQRLMVQKTEAHTPSDRESSMVLAVKTYSEALARSINRTLAESATLSQSLDRSFPNRILQRMTEPPALDEKAVRNELAELEQKRARLAKVDLLEKSDGQSIISHNSFNEEALRILSEYISDTKKKLAVFDNLLAKIEVFTSIVNERFSFKNVSISRELGFNFNGYDGDTLDITSLSSGEQHELILLYGLIFNTKEDTLLLIDEPEISLHIAWQKKFLPDLRRIIELAPMDVVLATHSPQLLSGNLDLTVQLRGPSDARTKRR